MLENIVHAVLGVLIPVCELIGITVVGISAISAFVQYLRNLLTRRQFDVKYRLAGGLALSLEFKMAAEILKTVQVQELNELLVLGIVIALRALLSVLIHFEMKKED